jgi:hypothetical protein
MTWRGVHPVVEAVTRDYHNGVRLTRQVVDTLEQRLVRDHDLGRWFVTISLLPKPG